MDTIACRTFLVAGSDERAAVSGHACVHCGTSSRESPLWRGFISDKCLAGLFKAGLR